MAKSSKKDKAAATETSSDFKIKKGDKVRLADAAQLDRSFVDNGHELGSRLPKAEKLAGVEGEIVEVFSETEIDFRSAVDDIVYRISGSSIAAVTVPSKLNEE